MKNRGAPFVRTPVFLLVLWAITSLAGEKVQLISLDNVWRYDGSGTNHETGWRVPEFDDSGWQTGLAPLGLDRTNGWGMAVATQTLENWVPAPPPWNFVLRVTTYFRTTFQYEPGGPSWMVISNFIDDGAVVYLNGAELTRLRMPATNPITHLTYASQSAVEGRSDVWLFKTNILIPGTNYLAVEIHNREGEDILLAMSIHLFEPELPQIVAAPSSITVDEGARSSFRVEVVGEFLHYQWYRDGTPLPAGTNAVLEFARTRMSDAVEYFVVVSNLAGSVASEGVTLTVIPDYAAPALMSAYWNDEIRWTYAVFSELMSDALLNPANYAISNELGSIIPVQSAQRSTGSAGDAVHVRHDPLTFGPRYWLIVNDLTDAAANANPISPGTKVPIGMRKVLVPVVSRWNYIDTGNVPTDWAQPGFNDTGWSNGLALLYDENGQLPGPKNTRYREGPITYYFRHAFDSPTNTPNGRITVRTLADDGFVVYLNGTELYRRRMPYAQVTSNTLATTEVNDGFWDWSYDFPGSLLRHGTNVIAAEVHQNHPDSSDSSFGLELTHTMEREPEYTTRLQIEQSQAGMILRWRGPALTLLTSPNADGPWFLWPDPASSPLVVEPQLETQFFRLRH